jgi:hypothetical protein
MVYPPSSTCDTVIAPIVTIRNAGLNTLTSVDLKYKVDAQTLQTYSWTGSLASLTTANITLPPYNFLSGTHTLTAYTSNPNSSADMNNMNDTIVRNFTVLAKPVGIQAPVQEGFVSTSFPPANWTIENSSNLLSRSTACGGYGTSSQSMKADFLTISTGTDMLESNYIDFANLLPPVTLYFDLAYASYSTTYFDSLAIELYDDCSGKSIRVYADGYPGMATAPPTTTSFIPTASQWRTDTVHLDTMSGKAPMKIRFLAITDYGNNLYIDNINLAGTPTGNAVPAHLNLQITVFPNPSTGVLFINNLPANSKLEIENVFGEQVYSAKEVSSNARIDLTHVCNGVYFIRISNERGSDVKKMIISK